MVELTEQMVRDGIVTKEDLAKLVRRRPPLKITLGNMIKEKIVDVEKIEDYIAKKARNGSIPFSWIKELEKEGINLEPVIRKVAEELHIPYVDLDEKEIDVQLFSRVPYNQLLRYHAVPVEETDLNVLVVFEDPLDMGAQDALQRLFPRKPIQVATSLPKKIMEVLQRMELSESLKEYVDAIRRDLKDGGMEKEGEEESPAVLKLIDLIFKNAVFKRASDIHIEATEKNCIVRDRIDGMLTQSFVFDKDIFSPLASRIKLLANLDIAEKRKPQDGRITTKVAGREFDFRVSTLPTLLGESIVLRILDKSKVLVKLEEAGMSEFCYKRFTEAIKVPYGIVLVTGPTGSGKTTTLYGALNAIKDVKDKIITVEDPVEYQMPGIQQVQVNPHADLTFAAALRSILRQDPDKIMIGEIRDTETLRIAIQAALTGHLVLSTLHTNDALSAVTRIIDMGIESYLVSGALVAIQAQRLVRKICPYCKTTEILTSHVMEEIQPYINVDNPVFYHGTGCKECNNTGYMGREMIAEVLPISEKLSRMIAANASKEQLTEQAMKEGFVTMFEDGIHKALAGETTVEEIFRVARL
ncbi:GspE/PulE family protein [Nitratifractor sp.]|uniref:GspE/PulE family protein n=1 Tax=Nitratifractor sp. TaxID=2268144 RepID=UPI0025CD23A7|nr:type II/IV secretion system protein [Nitratifractor sp.]